MEGGGGVRGGAGNPTLTLARNEASGYNIWYTLDNAVYCLDSDRFSPPSTC